MHIHCSTVLTVHLRLFVNSGYISPYSICNIFSTNITKCIVNVCGGHSTNPASFGNDDVKCYKNNVLRDWEVLFPLLIKYGRCWVRGMLRWCRDDVNSVTHGLSVLHATPRLER